MCTLNIDVRNVTKFLIVQQIWPHTDAGTSLEWQTFTSKQLLQQLHFTEKKTTTTTTTAAAASKKVVNTAAICAKSCFGSITVFASIWFNSTT